MRTDAFITGGAPMPHPTVPVVKAVGDSEDQLFRPSSGPQGRDAGERADRRTGAGPSRPIDPDCIYLDEDQDEVVKVGWTDEAREAAAAARDRNLAGKKTPTMSKGHFIHIASTIQQSHVSDKPAVANHFADSLAETSPRFDRDKFMRAATGTKVVEPGKPKMSRMHFEHLAGTIRALPAGDRDHMAHEFSRSLAGTNEHFDSGRFEHASTTDRTAKSLDFSWADGEVSQGEWLEQSEAWSPLDGVAKVGWTDEAREAAAAARAQNRGGYAPNQGPHQGQGANHPIYTTGQKMPGYNGKVTPLNADYHTAGRMVRQRFPDMQKEHHLAVGDKFARGAEQFDRDHQMVVGEALRNLKGDPGPLISGVVSDKFDDHTKNKLRSMAHAASSARGAAMAHYAAAGKKIETARTRLHGSNT